MRTIFTGFAPNLTRADLLLAWRFILLPSYWKNWRSGKAVGQAERFLESYLPTKHAVFFDSGRSALFFALRALGVGEGDEVLLQAYTCVVVANAVRWTGATPVYVDAREDFTMDPDDLEKKITAKGKVVIVQHTFGLPAQMDRLFFLAKKHGLKVIEDCAQSLGSSWQEQKLGTFGDLAILSFGSDKGVSCARGGGVVTNDPELAERVRACQRRLPPTSRLKIFQHLTHYPVFAFGKAYYHLGVGKWILWLAKKLGIINRIIYQPEKHGQQVSFYPTQLPNALAAILLRQLSEFEETIKHRVWVVARYRQLLKSNARVHLPPEQAGTVWLRFPLLVAEPRRLHSLAKRQGIILGDWYQTVIAPGDIDPGETGYTIGQCPEAERLAARSINLPTDRALGEREITRIVSTIKKYANQTDQ